MNPQNPDPKAQELAEKVGQTTVVQGGVVEVDPAIVPEAAPGQADPDQPKPDEPSEPKKDEPKTDKDGKPLLAGFAVGDLLKAPAKPPEPVETEDKELTSNRKVKLLVGIAIIIFVLGLLLLFVNLFLGIFVALIAAGVVAFTVFVPIK